MTDEQHSPLKGAAPDSADEQRAIADHALLHRALMCLDDLMCEFIEGAGPHPNKVIASSVQPSVKSEDGR